MFFRITLKHCYNKIIEQSKQFNKKNQGSTLGNPSLVNSYKDNEATAHE